jgi:hypothetical protein
VHPRLQRLAFRHLVGDAGQTDFLLGAHQALPHRLLTDQKGTRHLCRGESADRAQRQRDLHLGRKGRMAAGEDQPQHVVIENARIRRIVARGRIEFELMRERLLLATERDVAADAIDRLVAPDTDQPRAGIMRRLFLGPTLQRDRKGVLQRVLGEIEIADEADQRGERSPRLGAEDLFDLGGGHRGSYTLIPGRSEASNYDAQLRT